MTNRPNLIRFTFFICAAALLPALRTIAQEAAVTGNVRVDRLLSQMSIDEKITMIHGDLEDLATYQGQAGYLPGIRRLGIPPMRFADGPPGVLTRVPSSALTSTMGLAATFSRLDARLNGQVIGREAKSHGVSVALQPFINIARDFNFSRAYNTFGEDPFLTGEIGAAEIVGIQQEGVMSQAKHYIGYDTESRDVSIDDQALHEVYAAPFAAAIKAQVSSIMCSYNKINGVYACGDRNALFGLLREEMGFKGFVTSDWGAVHATNFINAGLDLEMPGPLPSPLADPSYFVNGQTFQEGNHPESTRSVPLTSLGLPEEPLRPFRTFTPEAAPTTDLKRLLAAGSISEDSITRAAGRVLLQMERFKYLDGLAPLEITPSAVTLNAATIEKTAEDAGVLLKNKNASLPLKIMGRRLVLIGPGAGQIVSVGQTGEKAVGRIERQVSPLAALRQLSGNAEGPAYKVADDMEGVPMPARLLDDGGKSGLQRDSGRSAPSGELNYTLANGKALPPNTTAAWSGDFQIAQAGRYRLHLQVLGCYATLVVDNQIVAENDLMWIHGDITQAGQDNVLPTKDGLDNLRVAMQLASGPHSIRVNVAPDQSQAPVQVRLNWVPPRQQEENYQAAINAARDAEVAVVFAWSRTRPAFGLPGDQDKLIHDVASVNPHTIVVLNTSQPIAMPWLGEVEAVLQMWWPGDEGGWATAKLLLGQANPAGRLPFTWPKRLQDTAASDPRFPERSIGGVNGKTTFSEGVLVGYRWFDAQQIEPLFPFGFGLSYTRFSYSKMQVSPAADSGVNVTALVTNSGSTAGEEVAQVYLEKPLPTPPGAQFAPNLLAGFERVPLQPGETKVVSIHVPLRQLQFWSTSEKRWVTPSDKRVFFMGGSSRDRRLEARTAGASSRSLGRAIRGSVRVRVGVAPATVPRRVPAYGDGPRGFD